MDCKLCGMRVCLTVSDPWDFCTEHGSGPFYGTILKVGRNPWDTQTDALLIQLIPPINYMKTLCEYFISSPRTKNDSVSNLLNCSEINCGLVQISSAHANSQDPFDLSWWRGGISVEGTLCKFRGK